MLFPTKAKVNNALIQLMARSVRIENRVVRLQEAMAEGSEFFDPVLEVEQFLSEVGEGTKALALVTAAVQFEQITPRSAARQLGQLDGHLGDYERQISAAERSYQLGKSV